MGFKVGSDVEKFIEDPPRHHRLEIDSKYERVGCCSWFGAFGLLILLVFVGWFALFGLVSFFAVTNSNYKDVISCPPSAPVVIATSEQNLEKKGAGSSIPPGQENSFSSNFSPPLPPSPPPATNEMPISIQQSQFVFAAIVTEIKSDTGTLLASYSSSSNNIETLLDSESDQTIDDTPAAPVAPSSDGTGLTQSGQSGQLDQVDEFSGDKNEMELGQVFLALNQLDEQATSEIPKYLVALPGVKMNWFEALQACLYEKMQLVAIETEEKWKEIERLVTENLDATTAQDDFWTSGTNLWTDDRQKFFWASTGMALNYTKWHANNPSLADGQNCIEITKTIDVPTSGSLRWNDYGCHVPARFICEKI